LGIGDWGFGGLGFGPRTQTPNPKTQTQNPNTQKPKLINNKKKNNLY